MSLTKNTLTEKIASLLPRALQLIRSRRAKTIGIIALVCFIIFSITGFFILPPYVRQIALETLSKELGREVTIESISLNPYTLSATIRGLVIKEPDKSRTFLSLGSLHLNLEIMSLIKRGLVIKEIRIEKPYFHIVRTAANTYNFSDIMERTQKPADTAAPPSKPLRFSLNNIQITDGSIDFIDEPMGKEHTVRALSVAIPFISNLPSYVDTFVKPSLKATVNGTDVVFRGDTKPFTNSFETSLNVNLKDFSIPFYMTYVPVKPKANIRSGLLDIGIVIAYRQYQDRPPTLTISGDLLLKKLDIVDLKNAPVASLDSFAVSTTSAELFDKRFSFSNIVLQSPNLTVNRDRSGALTLFSLFPEQSAPAGKSDAAATAESKASVEAGNIEVRKGVISFSDASNPKPFTTKLSQIEVRVAHFSTVKDKPTAFSSAFITESGEIVKVAGELGVDPLFCEGKLSLASVSLKKYMPYLMKQVRFDIADGKLDFITGIKYRTGGEKPVMQLVALEASLKDFRAAMRDEKNDFLRVPIFSIKDTAIDLTEQKVDIGSMSTDKGLIFVRRDKDGSLNLAKLMPPAPPPPLAAKPPKTKVQATKPLPWIITIRSLNADHYAARVEDLSTAEPFRIDLDGIAFKAEGLSTAKDTKGTASLSCRVARKGTVKASGNVFLEPLNAALSINVKNLPIAPLQPYVADKINVLIADGAVNAGGRVTALMSPKEGLKASYKGKFWINHFATADRTNAEDLLKWDTLYLGEMDARYAPLFVHINEIALTNFYSRIIISAKRTINLQEILNTSQPQQQAAAQAQPAQTATQPPAPAQSPVPQKPEQKNIRIDKITLQGGTVNFTDYSIKPAFSANLIEIGGRISGLSSEADKFGEVELRGKYDRYAPLEITGKINPLRDDLYVELKADFKDMDLTATSPYSGRYAGYTVQKGKLSFQLEYLIVKNKLDAKNSLFLDQFTFGDHVESPDATKLPVKLAVALLKNRSGEIKLDIPVSGEINDPKFSIGSVILKIILNLLAKAATSPFALLGAVFGGGGEQLSYIEFDYGVSAFSDDSKKKLDTLVKILHDRPGLKMDIEGHADPEKDREGLKQYLVSRKVKAQKIKDLTRKGTEVPSLDAVTVTAQEYPEYLKRAYKEEKFPKPRNLIGMAKDLPVPEMEKLMLTNMKVTEEDLKNLSSERAMAVKDYLLKSKQVEQERIFLIVPKSLEAEKKESVKGSRVDFKLK